MKKSILIPALLVAFLFVPIFSVQSQSEKDIKAKIEKMNKEMIDAMMKGDYEKSLSFYAKDAISLPSYQPMMKGIDAIKEANEAMAGSGVNFKSFEIFTEKVFMGGDLIVEIGTYKMAMEMPGMSELFNDVGKYITVWEKQKDGSLKVKADTWNTDSNPWMQGGM